MAAKTSLARQLELLKLPQTSAHKETHGSASFLYGFLEAKSIDADVHFSVACQGLEGLIKIDPYVETFNETLFHESSKKFDRGLTAKETNEKIDIIIEEYLFRVVSKYFQLSDTHKTIEWLIYRYKVNEYNVDALLGAVLPYHETRQFVRLLQTCPAIKNPNNSRWYWLKTIQENGVPLAKSVLLRHCLSSVEFIRFITDSVFKAIQIDGENSIFPSFLVSFCLNLLERNSNELTFSMVASALSKSLRMKNQSLYIASYIIFSHLCSVTKLDAQVVEKLLKTFARKIKEEVFEGALFSFNIVCYTQDITTLPIEFLTDDFISNIANYGNTYNLEHILRCCLLSIIYYSDENSSSETLELYKNYIDKLLQTKKGLCANTISSVILSIDHRIEEQMSGHLSSFCSFIICSLDKLSPAWFDSAVSNLKSIENLSLLGTSVPLARRLHLSTIQHENDTDSTNEQTTENASDRQADENDLAQQKNDNQSSEHHETLLYLANNFTSIMSSNDLTYLEQVIKSNLLSDCNLTDIDMPTFLADYAAQFYLVLISSIQTDLHQDLSVSIIDALHNNLFDSSTEDVEPIQLVSFFLRVLLFISESGVSNSTMNNLKLLNLIKKRLRKITVDGPFIVKVLQHLMPIDDIYDTFAYSKKEVSAEKRTKLDVSSQSDATLFASSMDFKNESKFATGWKLLRIYVGLFQNKGNLTNTTPLIKTLFDYLKLTFMEVDDNSNEFTRQTILYAIDNCIELRLGKKSSALARGKSHDVTKNNVDRMEVDQEEDLAEFLNSINVDIIIDCMRESRFKETQKVALLLLSLIAPHFQQQILDYLVAIFTFIGTSLLQCDDQYSLAILFETMESIIPIILQNDDTNVQKVAKEHEELDKKQYILSIFVKSFSDIPSYRRLPLFTKLVQLLGEDRFLSVVAVRLLEEACLLKTKTSRSEKEVWISFLQALFLQFPSSVAFSSLCTLLCLFERKFFDHHLKKKTLQKNLVYANIMEAIESVDKNESRFALNSLKALSESICKSFSTKIIYDSDKLACGVEILRFIVLVISDSKFAQEAALMARGVQSGLLLHFLNLLLELIVSLGPNDSLMKISLNVYRKRIKSTLDEILLKYNSLLPAESLIEIVINDLLKNSAQFDSSLSLLIQRKALELLNEKLNALEAHEMDKKLAVNIIRSLNKHLSMENEQTSKLNDQKIHNIQLMMLSLKFSTKFIIITDGETTSQKTTNCLTNALQQVYKLANSVTINRSKGDISARDKSLQNLKGSCVLCITQLLCTMSLEGIEHLSNVVGLILDDIQTEDDIVIISNVSALSKIIVKFPQFLSPHLKLIILRLLSAYTLCDKIVNLRSKLQIIWSNLAKLVPKRVMFEAIDTSYEEAAAISPTSVIELMTLFKLSCDTLEKSDVEVIAKNFKNFMIKALSYRSVNSDRVNLQTIEQLEASFGEAFSAFIPKLTEATFRPIFFRLLEWSIQFDNLKQIDKLNNSFYLPNECYFRMVAFYRFCSLLADRLKSLFCVFVAPSILNNCSEMLLAYHSINSESNDEETDEFVTSERQVKAQESRLKLVDPKLGEPLIAAILATLSKCFLYDLTGSFVNKDCTSLIVKPIVNQISNLFGSEADFETRLDLILQCTQFLIQNNKDETLIKEFNYQILLKTRESSEKIRVGAIKVLHRLILTCSEDYLPFIPESIPFIAELSEDESELVEAHVKKLIIDIEQLVGEPINKYL